MAFALEFRFGKKQRRTLKRNKAGYTAIQSDDWAGAVMRKPLGIQKCDGRTDRPTDTARCRVACPRLKTSTVVPHYGVH